MNLQDISLRFFIFLLGYFALLALLPEVIPTDREKPNVAAKAGFNVAVAYLTIGFWSVAGLLFFARYPAPGYPDTTPGYPDTKGGAIPSQAVAPHLAKGRRILECSIVALLAMLFYSPPLLARYGPFIEDSYFINILWRMQCGELPYRDFEFLYGPLMIYLAKYWLDLVGFSLQNYYWLISLLQGLLYCSLMALCQVYVKTTWRRYLTFLLLSGMLLDSLLGLNYIGWRVFGTLLAILAASSEQRKPIYAALAGTLVGLQIVYSYEYGLVALIALTMVYAVDCLKAPRRQPMVQCLIFLLTAVGVSLVLIAWFKGGFREEGFAAFFHSTLAALSYAGETGLGNFHFYWTLNSLALFGLLTTAIIAVGSGLSGITKQAMNSGDRMLLASLLFALGTLRMAIQRADVWHLSLPFIALAAVIMWRQPTRLFSFNPSLRMLANACLIVAVVTRLIGLMPTASYFIGGKAKGALDLLNGMPTAGLQQTRSYSIHSERSIADPGIEKVAAFLADPEHRHKPVMFYSTLWELAAPLSVCPTGYSFYDLPYTSRYRPLMDELERQPTTLVLMESTIYQRLFEGLSPAPFEEQLSKAKLLASKVSSIHYSQKQAEAEIKYDLWRRKLGEYLRLHYHALHYIDDVVILERNTTSSTPPAPSQNQTQDDFR